MAFAEFEKNKIVMKGRFVEGKFTSGQKLTICESTTEEMGLFAENFQLR